MKSVLLLFLGIFLLQLNGLSQSTAESLAIKLGERHTLYPGEKVFVHTDRDIYSENQMIWFKAYITNASSHVPMDLSKVLHVEVLDNNLEIIESRKLFIDGGFAVGNILLPEKLTSGNYVLRAYTNYMLNQGYEYFFRKDITIIDLEAPESLLVDEIVSSNALLENKLDLRFFPEGGHMVSGQVQVLGLKATGTDGYGKYVKGAIYFDNGDKVVEFESDSIGIGTLSFVPQYGKKYYAQTENSELRYNLPEIQEFGFMLQARLRNGSLSISARHTQGIDLQDYFILVHSRGLPVSLLSGQPGSTSLIARLNTSDFPPGIAVITLFDPEAKALAERLIFIPPIESDQVSIEANKNDYKTRENVQLQMNLNNIDSAQFSVSIVRPEYLSEEEGRTNIHSYLLMQSDIRGIIEKPNRYFDIENESRYEQLDALMLTQGWRRFDWPDLENQRPDLSFKPEFGITVEGKVLDFYNDLKTKTAEVTLSFMENFLATEMTVTDEDGNFSFMNLQFVDSVTAIFQAEALEENERKKNRKKEDEKKDPYKVKLSKRNPEPPHRLDSLTARDPASIGYRNYMESAELISKIIDAYNFDENTIVLDEISVQGYRDSWKDSPFNRGQLYRNPTRRFVVDSTQVGNRFSIIEMLRRIPGIQVYGTFPDYQVRIRNSVSIQLDPTPLFLIDNIPTDLAFVSTMDATQIEFIDVLSTAQATMYGAQGYGGVIALYTRQDATPQGGNAQLDKLNWGINSFDLVGYNTPDAFYAPRYDVKKEEHIRPDYRSVLHWEPVVLVRNSGPTVFDFYTSDEKAEYLIIIQGMTYDGLPVYKESSITVGKEE